jgi:4-amino-4-deoxy-L-arabinose transferase-like glycosyltransferase
MSWIKKIDPALACILLLALALRLMYVTLPFLDAHRWREVDTLAMARYFHEDSFNIFYPQVNWGGPARAYVECEFPLLPAIAAVLFTFTGVTEATCRMVTIAFSIGSIIALYALVRQILDVRAARGAAFLAAISPSFVYYGRSFIPDVPMLAFSVASLAFFVSYFRTEKRSHLWLASAMTALAWLVKISGLISLAPIVAIAWCARGWKIWRDWRFMLAVSIALVLTAAWYWHAYNIAETTGLSYGVWHPTHAYPPRFAEGPFENFEKWSTRTSFYDPEYYRLLLGRIWGIHLMPMGFCGAVLGLIMWTRRETRLIADAWLAALLLFFFVVSEGNRGHDYYQLAIVLVAAMYFGAATAPLFDGEWIRRHVIGGRFALPIYTTAIFALSVVTFYFSGVLTSHFRPDDLDTHIADAGRAVAKHIPQNALIVVTEYGANSPMMLYYANTRGWSFDPQRLSPATMERLKAQGARYFAANEWSAVVGQRRDLAEYLGQYVEVPMPGAPRDVVLIDLQHRH